MRRLFLFILLAISGAAFGQINKQSPRYVDIAQLAWQEDYAISLASPGGNTELAIQNLSSDYFKTNPTAAALAKAWIDFNLYGLEVAKKGLSKTDIASADKDLIFVQLAFFGKDWPMFKKLSQSFKKKYPKHSGIFKLEMREFVDRKFYKENLEKDINRFLQRNDSILSATNASEDQLYFSLSRFDILNKGHLFLDGKQYDRQTFYPVLLQLYQQHKQEMHLETLNFMFNYCKTEECENIKQTVMADQNKQSSALSMVFELLLGKRKNQPAAEIEKKLKDLLAQEKNPAELEKIKGLIRLSAIDSPPNIGLMNEIKKIDFSKTFVEQLNPSVPKATLYTYFTAEINKYPQAKPQAELEKIPYLSADDIQMSLGVMAISSVYSDKMANSYTNTYGGFAVLEKAPNARDVASTDAYIAFLDRNPLFEDEGTWGRTLAHPTSLADLKSFMVLLDQLIDKYPAALTLRKVKGQIYNDDTNKLLITPEAKPDIYFDFLQNFIILTASDWQMDPISENFTEYLNLAKTEIYTRDNILANLYNVLNDQQKKEIKKLVEQMFKKYPANALLKKLADQLPLQ